MRAELGGSARWAFGLVSVAVLWGVGLEVAAVVVPAYSGSVDETLVQANGSGVLVPVGIPAVVAVLVGLILHRHCARGSSDVAARVLIALLLMFALVALSIGIFVLPMVVALAIAVNLTPDGRPPLPGTADDCAQPRVNCW